MKRVILFFYFRRIYRRIKNYRWRIHRRSISVGDVVGKLITDGICVLHRRKNSVGKTVKSCSDSFDFYLLFLLLFFNWFFYLSYLISLVWLLFILFKIIYRIEICFLISLSFNFFICQIWFQLFWFIFVLFEIIYEIEFVFQFHYFLTFSSIRFDPYFFYCYLFYLK